jgi:hypothetical protein
MLAHLGDLRFADLSASRSPSAFFGVGFAKNSQLL